MLRKRWIWLIVLVVIVAAAAGGAWSSRDQLAYAQIATGYAAKQLCSCMHVSGRTLEACLADYPQDVRRNIAISAAGDNVRASLLFGAIRSEATFEADYGCRIVE